MDKFSNKSELYIYTDIELQVAFRIATEDLASHDAETVKSAHHALEEIKAVQRGRKPYTASPARVIPIRNTRYPVGFVTE